MDDVWIWYDAHVCDRDDVVHGDRGLLHANAQIVVRSPAHGRAHHDAAQFQRYPHQRGVNSRLDIHNYKHILWPSQRLVHCVVGRQSLDVAVLR